MTNDAVIMTEGRNLLRQESLNSPESRLPMSAKFLGSAPNSGRGILPRRSGWKPLPLFRWIPTEHFKAGIEK